LDCECIFFRDVYLPAVFAQDKQIMNYKIAYEEALNQIVILLDRCYMIFRELEDTSNDPLMVAMARMKARLLAAER
jgi:hypothetical protein